MRACISMTLAIAMWAQATTANAVQLPSEASVVGAEVICKAPRTSDRTTATELVILDRAPALQLLSFFRSVNNHWISWGFNTAPAGDIQVTFRLQDNRAFLVQTWLGLEMIGTDAGRRDLTVAERRVLKTRLPECAHPERSDSTIEGDAPQAVRPHGERQLA